MHRGEKEVSSSIYENITQDLRDIMPKEIYLPISTKRKVSERQPKIWVKRTPFEGNPAIIVQIEEWLQEVGTRDFAVDVKLGVMYAIKGYKWERMTQKAEIKLEDVQEGTPIMGPMGGGVVTPTSKEPIPVTESTRKEGPTYTNTSTEGEARGNKISEKGGINKSNPQYSKPIETPKKKLTFKDEDKDEDEDAKEIQKKIEEVRRAEEALSLERERIEKERQEILKQQQEATKERLIAMRQQRKRLEESIAQMGKEMTQDSQLSYKDRLTRRQNLENEYGNQIERENQMMQDFINQVDKKDDITIETITTDSALSSTADPIEFMDDAAVMKVKIKHIKAVECKNRSLAMYKNFIKKAKQLKNTKEQEELENLLMASIKSLDRKIVKYKRVLDSYDRREQMYFTTMAKNSQEAEERKQREEEARKQKEEEAILKQRHLKLKQELTKMQKEAEMAKERRKAMEARVKEEKKKQIEKLQKLAEEQEELRKLQRQKAEEVLSEVFLANEKKQQKVEEERLTKEFLEKEKQREEKLTKELLEKEKQREEKLTKDFLEKERQKEELKQRKLTEQYLEQERIKEEKGQRQLTEQLLERERLEEERKRKQKLAKSTKTSGASPTRPDIKRKMTKPTTTEQEAERQKLFSALNDVVVNGKKPSKEKDLRWDYERDRKAQAVFGKIKKHSTESIEMCPKYGTHKHEGECPCTLCGKKGHDEKSCPSQSPPTKKRKIR